ncbi:MAG: hypothetical protein OXE50_09610 [Chloroflexi bacterium]|nr:hypothetical protein [Chloroflexota bacterium]
MNAPVPERQPLSPAAELLGEALALYGRNAPLLIGVAVSAAFTGNLIGLLASPSNDVAFVLWNQFIAAVIAGLQAPVWLLAMLARRGEPLSSAPVLYGLVTFARQFFAVGVLLGVAGGGLLLLAASVEALALPALPVLIFFAIRFSLTGPAIVQEARTPLQALARSWQAVEGHWWRTFLVQLPVLAFAVMLLWLSAELASSLDSAFLAVVTTSLALGVSAPLIALVETALFQEYSAGQPPAIEPRTLEEEEEA